MLIESPAKLNLALLVLGERRDGYHELLTLFHRVSLKDTLRLEKRDEGIRLSGAPLGVPKKKNLIVRAFHLLKRTYPFGGGVSVHLTKKIPVGGGLGGGSSNAAAFLVGMNRLFRLGLSKKELTGLGSKLGADVPFFISGGRHAIGRGRGDRIEPLTFKRRLWFLLLLRRGGLSTKKVYSSFRLPRPAPFLTGVTHDVKMASAFLERGKLSEAARFLVNDLTASAEEISPSLKETRERISALHLGICQMSGSGPTLFLIFPSRREALQALRRLRRHRRGQAVVLCHSY